MAKFGKTSLENLKGVHPQLVALHEFVVQHYDHSVDDGVRTVAEQTKNVAKGVSKTMESKHLPQADNLSHATDSKPFPFPDGSWALIDKCMAELKRIDPKLTILQFYHFQGVMKGAALHMGIDLRQGIDWDGNNDPSNQTFFDLPHNEIRSNS